MKTASLLLGAIAVSALPACGPGESRATPDSGAAARRARAPFTDDDEALLAAVADTILPDTAASPGAKAAGCGAAMRLLLTDCSTPEEQARAVAGLTALRTRAPRFATLPASEREALLRTIDTEAQAAGATHWFPLLHELSVRTYFMSETGHTKALRYVMEPGPHFQGCVPLRPGQPAWA